MEMNKKGQAMSGLTGTVIGLFILSVITFAIVFTASSLRGSLNATTDTDSISVMNKTVTAVSTIPNYYGLIIAMAIVVFIIGAVLGVVGIFGRGNFGGTA